MKRARVLPSLSPLNAAIEIPGSKSYTNRAIVMASLAHGTSILRKASPSEDSEALQACLKLLGITIVREQDALRVEGRGGAFSPFSGSFNVGPAGTTIRFLTALCAAAQGVEMTLEGSERMHQRPIRDLVDALRSLGGDLEYLQSDGCPPLKIRGNTLNQAMVSMKGTTSSQYTTALLLIAPLLSQGLEISVVGDQISKSYIDMTISSMKAFGVEVENDGYRRYSVPRSSHYTPTEYEVEGDGTGATYLWGAAALRGGTVRVYNTSFDSAQGDMTFPRLLERMGCTVNHGVDTEGRWIEVTGGEALSGIECDMEALPDAAQTLAVIAACAKGTTHITGLQSLKVKETDRLLALQTELGKCGIESTITESSITVQGGSPREAQIATYEDHRMGMSFALLGARESGIIIEEPSVVNKSYPHFWEHLKALGFRVELP